MIFKDQKAWDTIWTVPKAAREEEQMLEGRIKRVPILIFFSHM
jgi:hypothetical protein